MDPLSEILSLLKPEGYMFGGLDIGGAFSIRYPEMAGIKCQAFASGNGWLAVDGIDRPIRLQGGDCVLLPSTRAFVVGTDLAAEPTELLEAIGSPLDGEIRTINGGGTLTGVGGYFQLASNVGTDLLLDSLPPIVHIRDAPESSALRWYIEQIMAELREPKPGGSLVADHLIQLVLLQALRLHLAQGPTARSGWLFALADERISGAIYAMHADPAHAWTIDELARAVAMSRSTFAQRFKALVGSSPISYLTRWRMLLAQDRLANGDAPLGEIAPALGYESESAFSTAFKREMQLSPSDYRKQART